MSIRYASGAVQYPISTNEYFATPSLINVLKLWVGKSLILTTSDLSVRF